MKPKHAKPSYIYCGICGHTPRTSNDEPNFGPVKWWDCDDGWKIGTLCPGCWEEAKDDKPRPDDYAVRNNSEFANISDGNTDEDPTLAL